MKNSNYWSRFSKLKKNEWVTIIFMGITLIISLYFCIGMSVKMAQGYSLFGDLSYRDDGIEYAVTNTDIMILSMFWVLFSLLLALFIYTLFFKKIEHKPVVHKEIIHGRVVTIQQDEENNKKDDTKKDHE